MKQLPHLLYNLIHDLTQEGTYLLLAVRTVLQVTVAALLALLIVRTFAKRSPPARYGICICALVCMLFSPAINGLVSAADWSLVRLPILPASVATQALRRQALPSPHPSRMAALAPLVPETPTQNERPSLSGGTFHTPFALLLFVLWGSGMAFCLARLVHGQRRLAALRRDMVPLPPDSFEEIFQEVQHALDMPGVPPIFVSEQTAVPLVLGVFRPVIVLPEGLAERLERSQLQDVLIHEGAHIVLRHPWGMALQRVIGLLFWPHPLVSLLNSELARAREEVCDNFVLRHNDAPAYARTLLFVAESAAPLPLPGAALGLLSLRWQLEERVAGLLDPNRIRATRASRRGIGAAVTLLLMSGTGIAGIQMVEAADKTTATAAVRRTENSPFSPKRSAPPSYKKPFFSFALHDEDESRPGLVAVSVDTTSLPLLSGLHPVWAVPVPPHAVHKARTQSMQALRSVSQEDNDRQDNEPEELDVEKEDVEVSGDAESSEAEEAGADTQPAEEEEGEVQQNKLEAARHAAENVRQSAEALQRLQAEIQRQLEDLNPKDQEEAQEP